MGYWIDTFLGKSKNDKKYVYLPKDKKWLFCFKKRKVIEHEDCDYYEHNLECEKNNDAWGRTHRRSTRLGSSYVGDSCSILNECKYCLEEKRTVEKFRLSDDAIEWLEFWKNREK